MSDKFKKIALENKKIDIGGIKCTCCGIASRNHKTQRKNKNNLRRYCRRKLKHQLKDTNE